MEEVWKQELSIRVHNESWYRKIAPVEMSWSKIRLQLKKHFKESELASFQILDAYGKPVPSQIDRLDPHDPTKDVLVFLADVPGQSTSTFTISRLHSETRTLTSAFCLPLCREKWDFLLKNDKIEIKFHRGRTPFGYMAGSVYSAKMTGGTEISNPYQIPVMEWSKRLMQVERAFIKLPWDPAAEIDWYFGDEDYEYVNSGEGPARSFLTIRAPFQIVFEHPVRSGPGRIITRFNCYLYRIISLYPQKDYVCEDVQAEINSYEKAFVGKEQLTLDNGNMFSQLCIALRTYMYVPGLRGQGLDFKRINTCRNWFAVGNNAFPHPGIGFASNVSISSLYDMGDYYCRWDLSPTWHIRCMHQFMEGKNVPKIGDDYDFGHVVGSNWYDVIYTPLWGELV